MKKIFTILAIVIIVLVVALAIVFSSLGRIIKTGVQTVGSQVTKSQITVDDIDLSLLGGKLVIDNLVIGNPEGFKTDSAMRLGKVQVKLNPKSIFSDSIEIYEVLVDAPQITYERSLTSSNISVIQKNVNAFLPKDDGKDKDKEEDKDKEPGKKVVIDQVTVSNGQINLSATLLQGAALPVPLPTVSLVDIGKTRTVTPPEAAAQVLSKVLSSILDVATEALKKVASAPGELLQSVTSEGTKKAEEAKKDIQDAAAKVEEKAAEVSKDVKEAADSVKKAAGSILKTFTGKEDDAKK
ncbi:MAG: AsmA family protein [Lentisphaerae bacterium]|nr:AsmA family protein [Lentisphaerota bacterium]